VQGKAELVQQDMYALQQDMYAPDVSGMQAHEEMVRVIKDLQAERDNNRFLQRSLQQLSEAQEQDKQEMLRSGAEAQRQLHELRLLVMRRCLVSLSFMRRYSI
jgi:hypothetical protein